MRLCVRLSESRIEQYPGRTIRTLLDPKSTGTSGLILSVITYLPGCAVEPHSHEDQESIFVMKGKGTAKIGAELVDIEAGTAIYIPRGVTHSVMNPADEPIEAILVHAPLSDE